MQLTGRILSIGSMTERTITGQDGQPRTFCSLELTLGNGLDTVRAEATDAMARAVAARIATGELDTTEPVVADLRTSVREYERDGQRRVFTSIRLVNVAPLLPPGADGVTMCAS